MSTFGGMFTTSFSNLPNAGGETTSAAAELDNPQGNTNDDKIVPWPVFPGNPKETAKMTSLKRSNSCIRPLIWRKGVRWNPASVKRGANLIAAIVQSAGKIADKECNSCQKRNGPWEGCVVMSGELQGACANCRYGDNGQYCSFRPDCIPRPQWSKKLGKRAAHQLEVRIYHHP